MYGALFVPHGPSIDVHPDDHPTNDPAPDVAVLRRSIWKLSSIPGPEDLWFVAEVSSTTLSFDLTVKAGLYPRAGIAEYWVVERVATLRAPEQTILVAELF